MVIELINDHNKFKDLKEDWDSLLEKSRNKSIFLTWEWLFFWWKNFSDDKELLILIIRNENSRQIAGIAPLCIQKSKLFMVIPIRRITFLGSSEVASDFLDFIVYPGLEGEITKLIYSYLNKINNKWDIIELADVKEDSKSIELFKQNINSEYKVVERTSHICPFINLPQNYDAMKRSLSYKMRKNLNNHTNRLEVKYKVVFTINDEVSQMNKVIDHLFKLHNERFNSKNNNKDLESKFKGNKIRNFHYGVASYFLSKKWLKIYCLKHNGRVIAFLYTFQYKDSLFCYQSGIDPSWRKWSLGSVLYGYSIKDSIENGLNEFHYLRGTESYKLKWTKVAKRTVKLIILNKDHMANLSVAIDVNKNRIKQFIKNKLYKKSLFNEFIISR